MYASTPYKSHYQKAASEAKAEAAMGSRKLRRTKKAKPKKITLFPERIPRTHQGMQSHLLLLLLTTAVMLNTEQDVCLRGVYEAKPSEEKIRPAFVAACKRLLEEQMGTIK